MIPDEIRSWEKLKAALDDPEKGPKLRVADRAALKEREGGATVMIASFAPQRDWQGKEPRSNRQATRIKPPFDVMLDIMRRGGAQIVSFGMQ